MKRYLFLAAWVEGSDSAFDNNNGYNGVNSQHDLIPCFLAKRDDNLIAVIIEGAPNDEVASTYGRAECWHHNMTAHDSVSLSIELDSEIIAPALAEALRSLKVRAVNLLES